MTTVKDLIKDKIISKFKPKKVLPNNFLSWPSSHSESRTESSFLSWPSSHSENRKESLKEHILGHHGEWSTESEYKETEHKLKMKNGEFPYHEIHDHPDIKPQKLTAEHKKAIRHYTHVSGSSKDDSSGNMNSYLRNRSGDKTAHSRVWMSKYNDRENAHKEAIKKLSSAFTHENTNKAHITTYGGIPSSVGDKLEKAKKDSKHTLAGFTSTSTKRRTAHHFAKDYDAVEQTGHHHIVKYNVEPHAGLSVVHHSGYSENEIMIHHGAHVTYHGTDIHKHPDGTTTHVHHMTVHPTHTKLEDYPNEYTG